MNIQTIVLNEKNYKNQIDNAKKIAQRKSAPVALVAPMNFFQIYKNEKINKKLEIRYEYLKVILKKYIKKR